MTADSQDRERLLSGRRRGSSSAAKVSYGSTGSNSAASDAETSESTSSTDTIEKKPIALRQHIILWVLIIATVTSSLAICLFPPFFPKIAEEKGCSATVYGFIIGTNCLASFILTPLAGKHLSAVGVKYGFIAGMFAGGMCCLLSGFLEFFAPGWEFVVLSVALRVVHAAGNAFVITATFTFTAKEFQSSVGKIFSLTRTAMSLGQLFGPSIGGAIYGFGGFYMPFVVMGAIQVLAAIVSVPLLPECSLRSSSQSSSEGRRSRITVLSMLMIPRIWFSFSTFLVATACNGFLSINLEPQVLRRFELTPLWVGVLFGLKDGSNMITSPIWGMLCDRSAKTTVKPYIVATCILAGMSFFLLGGSSVIGLHFTMTIPLVVSALLLNGAGIGGQQVAGIMDALRETVNAGYPDDPSMHGLIAGMWTSFSGAGRFISRAGSGFLVDHIGFEWTSVLATALQLLVASATLLYTIFCECRMKNGKSVHWEDVTIIEDESSDEVVFTESNSPSESIMGRSVCIEIPYSNAKEARHARRLRAARSLPPPQMRRPSTRQTSETHAPASVHESKFHSSMDL